VRGGVGGIRRAGGEGGGGGLARVGKVKYRGVQLLEQNRTYRNKIWKLGGTHKRAQCCLRHRVKNHPAHRLPPLRMWNAQGNKKLTVCWLSEF